MIHGFLKLGASLGTRHSIATPGLVVTSTCYNPGYILQEFHVDHSPINELFQTLQIRPAIYGVGLHFRDPILHAHDPSNFGIGIGIAFVHSSADGARILAKVDLLVSRRGRPASVEGALSEVVVQLSYHARAGGSAREGSSTPPTTSLYIIPAKRIGSGYTRGIHIPQTLSIVCDTAVSRTAERRIPRAREPFFTRHGVRMTLQGRRSPCKYAVGFGDGRHRWVYWACHDGVLVSTGIRVLVRDHRYPPKTPLPTTIGNRILSKHVLLPRYLIAYIKLHRFHCRLREKERHIRQSVRNSILTIA
mmetsp:Transcript_9180/g.16609  ORF Transcript_9180/g.16609 Transcript_9180/m.16609 type:complete len:304 (-) Transcript_9180:1739-2650(-)